MSSSGAGRPPRPRRGHAVERRQAARPAPPYGGGGVGEPVELRAAVHGDRLPRRADRRAAVDGRGSADDGGADGRPSVVEAEALPADAPRGAVGEGVHPVPPGPPPGGVGELDPHGREERAVLRGGRGEGPRHVGPRPDVGDPRPLSPRFRRALAAAPSGPRRWPGEGLVREVGEAALRLEPLEGAVELEGVGDLEPPPRLERGVVDHDVCVGDAPLVVVVVDDGDLVVREVLRRPLDGEPPQGGEVDAGAGVGGEDVVLPRPRGPPAPRPPVSGGLPHRVHLRCPVAGAVAREVALPVLFGRPDIQEVVGERPAVPLEVAHDPAGPGVPAYRFDDSHPSPPTGRGRGDR